MFLELNYNHRYEELLFLKSTYEQDATFSHAKLSQPGCQSIRETEHTVTVKVDLPITAQSPTPDTNQALHVDIAFPCNRTPFLYCTVKYSRISYSCCFNPLYLYCR